jgi:hypothetical protein
MNARLAVGLGIWCAALLWWRPDLRSEEWGVVLLLLAPLVLVPLGLARIERREPLLLPGPGRWLAFPGAVLLTVAYVLPRGIPAAALALPWCAVTLLVAAAGLLRLWHGPRGVGELGIPVGCIYLAVGGTWAVIDRAGLRPMDLPAVIVQLTAIHFHHAGFVLPVASTLAFRVLPGWLTRVAVLGVCFGILLVAAGITVAESDGGPWLEVFAAWFTALSGCVVAGVHLRLAARRGHGTLPRCAFALAGLSLLFGMVLVGLFGTRGVQGFGLDYGWMRALHGTANGLGFGLLGTWAWSRTADPA